MAQAPAEPRRVVEDLYAAFVRGELSTVLDAVSDDCDWRFCGPHSVPYTGEYRGRVGVARFFERLDASVRLTAFEPGTFLVDGETVVVLGRDAGTALRHCRPVAYDWVHVFTVRDGRVAAFREYVDGPAIDAAFR